MLVEFDQTTTHKVKSRLRRGVRLKPSLPSGSFQNDFTDHCFGDDLGAVQRVAHLDTSSVRATDVEMFRQHRLHVVEHCVEVVAIH